MRAYGGAARDCVRAAPKAFVHRRVCLRLEAGFDALGSVYNVLSKCAAQTVGEEYLESGAVRLVVQVGVRLRVRLCVRLRVSHVSWFQGVSMVLQCCRRWATRAGGAELWGQTMQLASNSSGREVFSVFGDPCHVAV